MKRYMYQLSDEEILEKLCKILPKLKDTIESYGLEIFNDSHKNPTLFCINLMREEYISYEYEPYDFLGWSYGYYDMGELEKSGISLERFRTDDHSHNKAICMAVVAKHTKANEV
jgi:hypothetical protein